MTRTAITHQQIARTGLEETLAAANAGGSYFANDGMMFLHVVNGSGAPITVTVETPGVVDGLAIADQIITVTNAEERFIGPFPPGIYNQSDGTVYVDYSAVTDVSVAVLRL